MAKIGQKNTKPETIVRKLLHAMGRRFRLHRRDLPGTPDIVLPGRKKVIFVHGCFWHRHPGCSKATTPKTRQEFWLDKFERNVERDRQKEEELQSAGWDVLTIWECETKDMEALRSKLEAWLQQP
ncbi:DNA mismatch endonuclease Vsr [Sphingobium chlorophenolicum L-1]|uniref:DNA mismatch endonuclease Vsr n=2 Tax=Sphingobium chlorophenolicum TaxID=46429 RepID=F6EVB4_SPHCR|nr:DNA mismatch endonuclease Vsr [Sphingobium chlorophenolicum L-1]